MPEVTPEPHLSVHAPRRSARGIALVLHGGRSDSVAPTSSVQLSVLRMVPFAKALARAGRRDGLVVARLRFAVRGWNGHLRSPVADARWALDELARRFPGVPVVLVGHSMGGRTAVYAAGHPAVVGVVGLAPWLERADPVEQLAGRRVLFAHGTRDRMTSAQGSAAFAQRARAAGAEVSFVSVADESHAMLRRASVWHRLAAGFTVGVLFGRTPAGTSDETVKDPTENVVAEALAGTGLLVV